MPGCISDQGIGILHAQALIVFHLRRPCLMLHSLQIFALLTFTSNSSEVDRSCYSFEALGRLDRLEIALFGNRGTASTPAQSVAIVCSITRVWSDNPGTTPWITKSVARPKIVNHQVCAITMSSLFGNAVGSTRSNTEYMSAVNSKRRFSGSSTRSRRS